MPPYVVQPGESWASIAGKLTGDQRQFMNLMAANGGQIMLHPGDTIEVPDNLPPNPVINGSELRAVTEQANAMGLTNFWKGDFGDGGGPAGGGAPSSLSSERPGGGTRQGGFGAGGYLPPAHSTPGTSVAPGATGRLNISEGTPRRFGVQQYDQPIGPVPGPDPNGPQGSNTFRLPSNTNARETFLPVMGAGRVTPPAQTFLPSVVGGSPRPSGGAPMGPPPAQTYLPLMGPHRATPPPPPLDTGGDPVSLLRRLLDWLGQQGQGSLDAYWNTRAGR
jgi:hypothetical protein